MDVDIVEACLFGDEAIDEAFHFGDFFRGDAPTVAFLKSGYVGCCDGADEVEVVGFGCGGGAAGGDDGWQDEQDREGYRSHVVFVGIRRGRLSFGMRWKCDGGPITECFDCGQVNGRYNSARCASDKAVLILKSSAIRELWRRLCERSR